MEELYEYIKRHRNAKVAKCVTTSLRAFINVPRTVKSGEFVITKAKPSTTRRFDLLLGKAVNRPNGKSCLVSIFTEEHRPPLIEKAVWRVTYWTGMGQSLESAFSNTCPTPPKEIGDAPSPLWDIVDRTTILMYRAIRSTVADLTGSQVGGFAANHVTHMVKNYCVHSARGEDTVAAAWLRLAEATLHNPIIGKTKDGKSIAILVG